MDNPPNAKVKTSRARKIFIISGVTLGVACFMFLLSYFMERPLDCSASNWSKEERQFHRDLGDIKQAGLILFVHASDNNGKYPYDLGVFLKTELLNPSFYPDAEIQQSKRLFYKKDGRQFRWIYTPGLTVSDDPRIILLRSAEKFKSKRSSREGVFVYTLGQGIEYVKDPDKDIITVSGKPTLRGK